MTIFEITLWGITIAPSYYGLMYVIGFGFGYRYLQKKQILEKQHLEDLFFYVFLGVLLGGRIGYVLFYDIGYYFSNPLDILQVWKGGMSFHGGFLGVIGAVFLFCRKYQLAFLKIMDELALIIPIGIGAGRIGNYLNKELLGFTPYHGFAAIEKNGIYYFPSPLLEAFLEGIILFIILYFVHKYKKFHGQTGVFFLLGYGFFRLIVELFFRQPDSHLGYIFGPFSMGAILTLPMIGAGIILYFILKKNEILNK